MAPDVSFYFYFYFLHVTLVRYLLCHLCSAYFLDGFQHNRLYFIWRVYVLRNCALLGCAGSLDSEAGIYALSYDQTGSRLITCEADKTIKFWKEDETATPESHPVHFRPPKDMRRF